MNEDQVDNRIYDFFTFMIERYPKTFTELTSDRSKYMCVVKTCGSHELLEWLDEDDIDTSLINMNGKMFLGLIPEESQVFINLFCCNIRMHDIHDKINKAGIAIEGCFTSGLYSGTNIKYFDEKNYDIDYTGPVPRSYRLNTYQKTLIHDGIVLIDDHQHLDILNTSDIKHYKPRGLTTQYITGYLLIYNDKLTTSINEIRKMILLDDNNREIDGSNVTIDYSRRKVIIEDKMYDFTEHGIKYRMKNEKFFHIQKGCMTVGKDANNNTVIFYQENIDMYSLAALCEILELHSAVVLCTGQSHAIWKAEQPIYFNHTDFIGNPYDYVSDVLTFAT